MIHASHDENGNVVIELWNHDKKLTIYIGDGKCNTISVIRSFNSSIKDMESEVVKRSDLESLLRNIQWLVGE
jgi:hypothetical protein